MTLILTNEDIEQILTMDDLVPALEEAYIELVNGRGGNRVRSDIVTPTTLRDDGLYALKSMDGVIPKFGIGTVRQKPGEVLLKDRLTGILYCQLGA